MAQNLVASTSKFHIYSSFNLSTDDISALSLLYAPLIGNDAFTLYMALAALLNRNNLKSEEILHQDLFDIYSLKPVDFLRSKNKLEGIGLLLTYEKDGDYIYVLLPPLSPKNFIKDAVYGLYLHSKVRKEAYELIKKHFLIEKPDVLGYKEITKSFDEVYSSRVSSDETFEKFSYLLGKNPTNYLDIKNVTFDFDKFAKEINEDYLEAGIDSTFKEQIIKLSFVYLFNEHDMATLFMDSINKNGYFDYRILKKKANVLFEYRRNMNAPKLVEKEELDGKPSDLVSFLDNASPSRVLQMVNPKYPATYLATINEIYNSISLPRGVINCMIIKTLRDKGGELPPVTYFKKVAESWIQDNILSTKDAVVYITTTKESRPSKSRKDSDFSSQSKREIVWKEAK